MKRLTFGLMILLLISMISFAFNMRSVKAEPRTWVVDDDGPADFHTIHEAIDIANPGDTIFVYNGTYNELLRIYKNRLTIAGENKSNTIIDGGGYTVIRIYADNVIISGFTVQNGGSQHAGYGYSTSIYLGGEWEERRSCIIRDNVLSNSLYGITSELCSDNTLIDNMILGTEIGIQFSYSYDTTVERNVIANNTWSPTYGWGGGIYLSYSNNNTLAYNMISNTTEVGIWLHESHDNIIMSNTISQNPEIEMEHSSGVYLGDNSFNNTIVDNVITKSLVGVYASQLAYNNTIMGNTITNLTSYMCGINIWGYNNNVVGNTITNMGYVGIQLNSVSSDGQYGTPNACADNVVSGNTITYSTFGINLILAAFSNIIAQNNLSHNGLGIYISDPSDNNTVINNFVSNNDYGILLFSSNNTKVYHNNFIDNTHQVLLSDSFNTVWDDGYPSGGNYWSDYTGQDLNEDGIGDTPHVIEENNQDNYPLMEQWSRVDVAIVSVVPSTAEVYIGQIVNISITVKNEGDTTKTFDVTCKYGLEGVEHLIGTQTVNNLAPNATATLTFSWTTADVTLHIITAEIRQLVCETDTDDNTLTSLATVKVKMIGDMNGDDMIDMTDIRITAKAFAAYPSHPRWNPEADINNDGTVDMKDIRIVAKNFGKTAINS